MIKKITAFALAVLLFSILKLSAQLPEYEVKTVFIEKIPKFFKWPTSANMEDLSKPFVISVIGRNPFGNNLTKQFSNKKVLDKKVEIRFINTIKEIEGSSVLFISSTERSKLQSIINFTKDKPILTMSDTEGFCETGVIINMYVNEESQVRWELNETNAKVAGFKVELYLLEVSRIINPLSKR